MELLRQQLDEMRKSLEGYESLNTELDMLKMVKNEIVQAKDEEISLLNEKLDDMRAEVERVGTVSSELEAIKMERSEILQLREEEIEALKTKLSEVQSQQDCVSGQDSLNDAMKAELDSLKTQAKEYAELMESHKQLVCELEALKEACADLQQKSSEGGMCVSMEAGTGVDRGESSMGDSGVDKSDGDELLSSVKSAQAGVECRDSVCQTDDVSK